MSLEAGMNAGFQAGLLAPPESAFMKWTTCLLGILVCCAVPASASQPWTIDALLNIPTLSDPQIRPDGQSFAYVRRNAVGNAWRSTIYIASIPSGAAQAVAAGARPRWSPDSAHLAYLDNQVHVSGAGIVTHSPLPVVTYCWTPDGHGI